MPVEHDLIQRVDALQQALRGAKTPTALFLGAGCPTVIQGADGQPLMPAIDGLTEACAAALEENVDCAESFACLLQKLATDGEEEPNVERLLSEIRGLNQVIGKSTICGLTRESLRTLERELCQKIAQTMDQELPKDGTPYHRLATWAGAIHRTEPIEIFTPNYDLLVEQALEDVHIPYFDGFSGSRRAFFDAFAVENDELPARWARVWKLHGSVNWFMSDDGEVYRSRDPGNYSCRLIHPSHLKYDESRTMPYFALIERMRRFLLRPSCLMVVCGYSFGDDHLNACISDSLQGNPSGTVFGLLHEELQRYSKALALASTRRNLVLLARDGGVMGRSEGPWREEEPPDDSEAWQRLVHWDEHMPSLKLGDFAVLGDFLSDVVGIAP